MTIMRIVAGFICAFLLFSGAPSHAASKNTPVPKTAHTFSLTPMAGGYLFSGKDNLKSGPIYSLKFSYNIIGSEMFNSLGIDAVAGYVDTTSTVDNSKAKFYHFRIDAVYPFILKKSRFTPFLSVGAGGNLYERNTGSEKKALVAYGAGLKYMLLDYLAVRADVRHILIVSPERRGNLEYTAGMTYIFGVERKPKPPADSDKDGVPDELDKCPGTPPGVKVDKNGCPVDSDRDGVPDYLDKCPDTLKGKKVDKNGCPEDPAKIPETTKPSESQESVKKSEPIVTPPSTPPKSEGVQSLAAAPVPAAQAKAAAAPAVQNPAGMAKLEQKTESAKERGVSPESKAVLPTTPAESTAMAGVPAGEAAREITAPVVAAPSKPALVPAIAPVEAAPAPVEKKTAKVAAEPAVTPLTYNVPPEEKRQLPEHPGKVTPETPAVIPAGGGLALIAVAGTGNGVEIRTSAPVNIFRYFRELNPARLVIDLPGVSNGTGQKIFSLGSLGLAGARVDAFKGKLRIVLDADSGKFPQFRVDKTASGLKVSIVEAGEKGGATAPQKIDGKAPASLAPPAGESAPAPRQMENGKAEYLLRFNVEFDTAKADIRPSYYSVLRKAVNLLKANPGTMAEIRGHTDSVGNAGYNILLSQRRAGLVRRYLVKNSGIDGSRIIVRRYGCYRPIADNATAAGRQKNRRTELTITIRKRDGAMEARTEGR